MVNMSSEKLSFCVLHPYIFNIVLLDAYHKSNIQNRVATPHVIKTSKVNDNKVVVEFQNDNTYSSSTNAKEANSKNTLKTKSKIPVREKLVVTSDNNDHTIRRSSRLANKPSKNYKC